MKWQWELPSECIDKHGCCHDSLGYSWGSIISTPNLLESIHQCCICLQSGPLCGEPELSSWIFDEQEQSGFSSGLSHMRRPIWRCRIPPWVMSFRWALNPLAWDIQAPNEDGFYYALRLHSMKRWSHSALACICIDMTSRDTYHSYHFADVITNLLDQLPGHLGNRMTSADKCHTPFNQQMFSSRWLNFTMELGTFGHLEGEIPALEITTCMPESGSI